MFHLSSVYLTSTFSTRKVTKIENTTKPRIYMMRQAVIDKPLSKQVMAQWTGAYHNTVHSFKAPQIAKSMGPTWGPSGADRTQMGPMLAPWTLLSGTPWSYCPLQFECQKRQATGLDAWASRVKCPARFVSHLHEICIYIWVVYSFCLFRCLFIIVTWWYVCGIVWASGRVGVNSIPELELQLNSNSGIGIEIGGIENRIEIKDSGIGIENRNWFFCNCYHIIY